jgi:uncharacterized glyoxalase superfamily protein PhnB
MADTRGSIIAAVVYDDQKAAMDWLTKAFGFEVCMLLEGADGKPAHVEMSFGDGVIMIASTFTECLGGPKSVNGKNTQFLHVHLETDIDAHCEKALAMGATLMQEPTTQFYGDRTYRCFDPEGHLWTFAQTVKVVTREEAEAATGLKITGWT